MYSRIFISTSGSNTLTTLGALQRIESLLKNTIIWNVAGTGALIIFLKCLGFTYRQIYEKLSEIPFLNNFVPNSSLSVSQKNMKEFEVYMHDWLFDRLKATKIHKPDITLGEIYESTKFVPCFIVYDKKRRELDILNPFKHRNVSLIDAVMASISNSSLFEYELEKTMFGDVLNVNAYPYSMSVDLGQDVNVKTLWVFNDSTIESSDDDLGPFQIIEDNLMRDFAERSYQRFKNLEVKNSDSALILYSKLYRGESSSSDNENLYREGSKQGELFLEGRDTRQAVLRDIELIENQE